MKRSWLNIGLWGLGLALILMGTFDLGPAQISGHWLMDWGRDGPDRAILAGSILLAVAFGLTVLDRVRAP